MSILSAIKNFTYDILGINDDTQVKAADAKKNDIKTPIISYEIKEGNSDTFNKQDQTSISNGQESYNIGQLKQSIENKCQANGIDYMGLLKNIGEVAGLTKAQFEQLSKEEQYGILSIVSSAIDESVEQKKKYGISENVSEEKVITADAKNVYEAKQAGAITNAKEFYDEVGDVNKELGDDFKDLSVAEQRARLEEYRTNKKNEFESYLQKRLQSTPEEQKDALEKNLRARQRFIEKGRFNNVIRTHSSETALQSIVMLSSNDIDYGAMTIMSTRVSDAERTKTADSANFEFFKGIAKSFYSFGEKLYAQSVQNYNAIMTSYMSGQALSRYQNDYVVARKAIENGDLDVPYLTEEVLSNTAIGIGTGAHHNVNMTPEEKARFLAKWEADAKLFGDYEYVISQTKANIERYLQEHPEKRSEIEAILKKKEEIIAQKKSKESLSRNAKNVDKDETLSKKRSYANNIKEKTSNEANITSAETSAKHKESISTTTNPILKNNIKASPIEIKNSLQNIGIQDAIESYGIKDTINAILDDQSLKHMRPQLVPVIKSLDLNSLKEICKDCSDSTFVFICKIVNPDFIQELQDNRTSLCYNAKKQVENMEKNVA